VLKCADDKLDITDNITIGCFKKQCKKPDDVVSISLCQGYFMGVTKAMNDMISTFDINLENMAK